MTETRHDALARVIGRGIMRNDKVGDIVDAVLELDARQYGPQDFVPGYRIRFIELENVCAYLKGEGWAGLLSFDEAVKAL